VGVADDQADPGQTTFDERAQEARPGVALVVAGGQLEAQDPPLADPATPTATSAAIDTTRPASRTLRYVASRKTYG
jgi:hypothetical protein